MDIVAVLVSFNKISIIAFFITLGFIIYEIYLFRKETIREKRPNIPKFDEGISVSSIQSPTLVAKTQEMAPVKRANSVPFYVGVLFLVIFGLISLFGYLNSKRTAPNEFSPSPTSIITFVSSKGIRIFELETWKELTDAEISKLKGGDKILIGIETIKNMDVDRARIRVNETEWKLNHITLNFDTKKNVYYNEYSISSGAASLKIEAQLHSQKDGWLGD